MHRSYISIFCLLAYLFTAVDSATFAQETDPIYLIESVEAKSTHQDPVMAKEMAFKSAQENAFRTLLSRITSSKNSRPTPLPQPDVIENLIRDITFIEEKIDVNFYHVKLDIRFQKDRIKDYLDRRGVELRALQQTKVLVIPLYQEAGVTRFWERNNLWLNIWERQNDLTLSGLKIITPQGTLQDMDALSYMDVLQLDEKKMQKLALQYDTENYIVSFAKMIPDIEQNKVKLDFHTLSYIKGVARDTYKFTETKSSIHDIPNAMEGAAQNIIEHTSLAIAARSIHTAFALTKGGEKKGYLIATNIANLEEFIEIEQTLREIPDFTDLQARRTNKQKAVWSITSNHPSAQIVVILQSYALDASSDPLHPHIINLK